MDDFVRDKFIEWGFQELVEVFKEHAIDEELFNDLNDEMLKDLIPKMGIRYKFTKHYNKYKGKENSLVAALNAPMLVNLLSNTMEFNEEGISDASTISLSVPSCSTPVQSPPTPLSVSEEEPTGIRNTENYYPHLANIGLPFQERTTLAQFLELQERGKEIVHSYKTIKKFSRSALATLVIERELKGHPDLRLDAKRFKELAQEIAVTFPGEFAESYYIPYCKTNNGKILTSKGILWDKYVNKRRIYRKIGLIPGKEHNSNSSTASSPAASPGPLDESVTDQIQWLKNSIKPWSRVRDHWESTCGRREDLTSIEEYLTTYPALKQPSGYALLEIDFEFKYANKSDKLLNDWGLFANKILRLAESQKTVCIIKTF